MKNLKTVILAAVLAIIALVIWRIESHKPIPAGENQNTPLTIATSTPVHSRAGLLTLQEKAKQYPLAKELIPGGTFINTPPFKLQELIGKKVILIDFWTYSCINCLRTLPYLNTWYEKYKDAGLTIIGVHTPEFDFEKNPDNVAKAVRDLGISYPVMQDNNYATWQSYENQYWPREYLIDIDGFIVHDHAGEGAYEETETAIQKALSERKQILGAGMNIDTGMATPHDAISVNPLGVGSPETYFGAERNQFLGNGTQSSAGNQSFSLPASFAPNTLYLDGEWNIAPQYAESRGSAKIVFKYKAKSVYFVASSQNGATIKVLRDGKPLGTSAGADVAKGTSSVFIKNERLYKLIEDTDYAEHTFMIEINDPGLRAYTLTFG